MNSRGIRALSVLLFVFALGALTGVFVDRHHLVPRAAPIELSAAALHNAAMGEMQKALNLDEEQVAQIHSILASHQDEVQTAWEVLRPEVQAAMQTVHVEIAGLLRPEQRDLYHEWLAERQQRHDEAPFVLPRH